MKISLRTIALFMIVLGVLVLLVGRNFPGNWIYSVVLIAFGASLFIKSRNGGNNGNKK